MHGLEADCERQEFNMVGSIHGLDWTGWDGSDPGFLISNHCSTVDAVSFKI